NPVSLNGGDAARNRVFLEIIRYRPKSRKKPGFFEFNEVTRNRVFLEIIGYRPKSRKKPGFFERWRGGQNYKYRVNCTR
ncbi:MULTISPECIES: hypothetical protein, partial [unclassified Microcoleus]|uniref:hypothetical protein n=1 Tax=unclassified Microcoleus TaxID=2642155 RepID=UPI0025FEDA1D